jgi:3-oxoacyl-[acyl-carrier protein] reductase
MKAGSRWNRAVITGAASGIGLAFARTLAAEGVALGLIDVSERALGDVEISLCSRGAIAHARVADVANTDMVNASFAELDGALGGIDLVVHCAAILGSGCFTEQSAEDFERVLRINLMGTVNVVRACVPSLRSSRGSVACIASTAALHGWPEMSAYSTAKFGVAGFCDAVRPELGRDGIGVTTVFPLLIDTPLLASPDLAPILRQGKAIPAQKVVDKTLAGLRKHKDRVYVPATVRFVAALQGLAPSLLDAYGKRFGLRR